MTVETEGDTEEIILINAKQEQHFKLKWKDIIKYHRWVPRKVFQVWGFQSY